MWKCIKTLAVCTRYKKAHLPPTRKRLYGWFVNISPGNNFLLMHSISSNALFGSNSEANPFFDYSFKTRSLIASWSKSSVFARSPAHWMNVQTCLWLPTPHDLDSGSTSASAATIWMRTSTLCSRRTYRRWRAKEQNQARRSSSLSWALMPKVICAVWCSPTSSGRINRSSAWKLSSATPTGSATARQWRRPHRKEVWQPCGMRIPQCASSCTTQWQCACMCSRYRCACSSRWWKPIACW